MKWCPWAACWLEQEHVRLDKALFNVNIDLHPLCLLLLPCPLVHKHKVMDTLTRCLERERLDPPPPTMPLPAPLAVYLIPAE